MKKIIAIAVLVLGSCLAVAQDYPSADQCPKGAHEVCTPAYYDANGNLVPSHCSWVCN